MSKTDKRLWIIVAAGLVIRLMLAPNTTGFEGDMRTFGNWGAVLANSPFGDYYTYAKIGDHLPGDLYLHWIIANIHDLFGRSNYLTDEYRVLLKLVPILFDTFLAVAAVWFAKSRFSESATLWLAIAISFSPPIILVSAVWGQWDSVSMAIFIIGFMLLWSNTPRPILATILFSWALLMKPPLFLLVAPAVCGYAWWHWQRDSDTRKLLLNLTGMLATAVASITLMMLPFGMTWFEAWGDNSLQGRLQLALDVYPYTTLGAANIWKIHESGIELIQDQHTLWGFSTQQIGNWLMWASVTWIAVRAVLANLTMPVVLWAMASLSYAWFMLPTRVHERYLFPAIIVLAILAALTHWKGQISGLAIAASALYFANLYIVYAPQSAEMMSTAFLGIAAGHVVVFGLLMLIPFRWLEVEPSPSRTAEAQTASG